MDEDSSEKKIGVEDTTRSSQRDFVSNAIQETTDKEVLSPIGQIILHDITSRAKEGKITTANMGTVLRRLRDEVGAGISPDQKGIRVASSKDEVLPVGLSEAIQNSIVYHNQPIEREDWGLGIKATVFRDEALRKFFNGDAYEAVLDLHRKLYKDKASVKLVRYKDTLVIVTEHMAGDQLKVTQILDCDFPKTAAYQEFEKKVQEENIDPASWPFSERRKENYIPVHNLIIEDTKSGKALDLRSLLPSDWSLQYLPTTDLAFAQDSMKKYLRYSEILSPEFLFGIFHEYGHSILDPQNLELFNEAKDLWERSRMQLGGARGLTQDIFNRTKELLVKNERGASARALQILRILSEQGFKTGASLESITKAMNNALESYERGYPGGTTSFIRRKAT